MEQVFQKDDEGCWIACVSMLTGIGYDEIRSRARFRDDVVTGRSATPIVKLLDELGYDCDSRSTTLKKVKTLAKLNTDALVYLRNVASDGCEKGGHWVVWDAQLCVLRDPDGLAATRRRVIKNFRSVKTRVSG